MSFSLSQTIADLKTRVSNVEVNGGGSGSGIANIQIGNVTYGNVPSVTSRNVNGVVYLDFVLANPITDAKQFGIVVAASTLHHVIDRIALPATATNTIQLTETPNSCPVIITISGFSFVESSGMFTVNRSAKTITWNATTAGFSLDSNLATEIYVGYETATTVTRINEKVTISTISNNTFTLVNTPNSTKIAILINGVVYLEEQGDFSVNRSTKVVTWNATTTGFSLDNTLTGYLAVSYEINS